MTLANISLVPFFRCRRALGTSTTQLANGGTRHITKELKNDAVDMARSRFTGAAVMDRSVDRGDLQGHHIKVHKAWNPATCGQDAMLNQDTDRVNLQKDGESAVVRARGRERRSDLSPAVRVWVATVRMHKDPQPLQFVVARRRG